MTKSLIMNSSLSQQLEDTQGRGYVEDTGFF